MVFDKLNKFKSIDPNIQRVVPIFYISSNPIECNVKTMLLKTDISIKEYIELQILF